MRCRRLGPPIANGGPQAHNTFSSSRDPQENRPAWQTR